MHVFYIWPWLVGYHKGHSNMKYPHCLWLLEIGLLQQLSCFKGWEYTYVSHMTRISVVNCAFILVTYVIAFVTIPMVKTTWVSLVTTCYAKHVHNNSYRYIDHMQCAIQTYAPKFAALLQNLGRSNWKNRERETGQEREWKMRTGICAKSCIKAEMNK